MPVCSGTEGLEVGYGGCSVGRTGDGVEEEEYSQLTLADGVPRVGATGLEGFLTVLGGDVSICFAYMVRTEEVLGQTHWVTVTVVVVVVLQVVVELISDSCAKATAAKAAATMRNFMFVCSLVSRTMFRFKLTIVGERMWGLSCRSLCSCGKSDWSE